MKQWLVMEKRHSDCSLVVFFKHALLILYCFILNREEREDMYHTITFIMETEWQSCLYKVKLIYIEK